MLSKIGGVSMTLRDWKEQTPINLQSALEPITEIWSNNGALGYTMEAGKEAGLNDDTIEALLSAMRRLFDKISIDEARQNYEKSNY